MGTSAGLNTFWFLVSTCYTGRPSKLHSVYWKDYLWGEVMKSAHPLYIPTLFSGFLHHCWSTKSFSEWVFPREARPDFTSVGLSLCCIHLAAWGFCWDRDHLCVFTCERVCVEWCFREDLHEVCKVAWSLPLKSVTSDTGKSVRRLVRHLSSQEGKVRLLSPWKQ